MSKNLHAKHVKFIRPYMQKCISNNCSAMKIQLNRLLIPSYGDGAHSVRIVLEEYWWGFTRDRGCNRFGVLIYKKLPIAPNIWLVLMKAFMAGLSEVLCNEIRSCVGMSRLSLPFYWAWMMGLLSLSPFSHSGRCRSVGCRICRVLLFGPVSTWCHTPSSQTSGPTHISAVHWLFYIVLHGTSACACCSAFWICALWCRNSGVLAW